MSFGNNLKKIRQDNNLTQEELARKINTSRSNIANYENDKNMPSVDILEKLSKNLNCSIDYLMGKSYYKNYEEFQQMDNFVLNYNRTAEEAELLAKTLNYINSHKEEDINNIVDNAINDIPAERQDAIKKSILHLHNRYSEQFYHYKNEISKFINESQKNKNNNLDTTIISINKKYYMCPLYNEILSKEPYWLDNNIKGRIVLDANIYNINKKNDYFSIEVNENYTNFRNTYGHYIIFQKQSNAKDDDIILTVIENSKPCIRKYKKLSNTLIMLQPIDSADVLEPLVIDITNTALSILGIAIGYFGKIELK